MSFSISEFTNAINEAGGIARTNKFKLYVVAPSIVMMQYKSMPKIGKHFVYTVQNVSIPTKTVSTNSVLAPGSEQKYPYAHEMEDLSVTFMCTKDLVERKFIDDWMNEVVRPNGGSFTIGYRNEYSGKLILHVYGEDGERPVDIIVFHACFPLSAGAIELSYEEQGEIATFETTFQIDYWERIPVSALPKEPWNQQKPTNELLDELARRNDSLPSLPENPRAGNSVMGRMLNTSTANKLMDKKDNWMVSPMRAVKARISEPVSRFERAKKSVATGYNRIKKYL